MRNFFLILLFFFFALNLNAQDSKKIGPEEYIATYKDLAIIEMHRSGVPASITLSQGLLESSNGNSKLAVEGKNHFGIKCKSDWTGRTIYIHDDAPDECFRAYNSALESYQDHSDFLRKNWRYQELFSLPITDYKRWAEGLRKAGYATNPKYDDILVNLINRYELHKLDNALLPAEEERRLVIRNHEIPAVYAEAGETVKDIAKKNELPAGRIYKWNDLPRGSEITEGDILYLKPKKRTGSEKSHVVQEGESMHDISQIYGIKLKHLYKKNLMEKGTEAAAGETLYMQQKREKGDSVAKAGMVKTIPAPKPPTIKPATPKTPAPQTKTTPEVKPVEIPKVVVETPAPIIIEKIEVPEFHLTKTGDNIYKIAEKYHIFEEDLLKWNQPKTDTSGRLIPGQKIFLSKDAADKYRNPEPEPVTPKQIDIPGPADETSSIPSESIFHKVKTGETVFGICTFYKITAVQLQNWNNLKGTNIQPGQRLRVSE
jgi:LysM repeat protein